MTSRPDRLNENRALRQLADRVRALERNQSFRLAPPRLWGNVVPINLISTAFGLLGGPLYVTDEAGLPSGQRFGTSFVDARSGGFWEWAGLRVHKVSGIAPGAYNFTEPWRGGVGIIAGGLPNGAILNTFALIASLLGSPGCIVTATVVTNDPADVVTFHGTWGDIVEPYSFSDAGAGHIAYLMHQLDATPTGAYAGLTVTYAGGASTERSTVYQMNFLNAPLVIGTTIVDHSEASLNFGTSGLLSEDVDPGQQLIVVPAARMQAIDAGRTTDAGLRTIIWNDRPANGMSLLPEWHDPSTDQWRPFPIERYGR